MSPPPSPTHSHPADAVADDGLFTMLFEAAPDAMFLADLGGIIQRANALAHEMFGWPPGTLVGESIDMLVPAAVRGAHAAHRGSFAASPVKRGMGARVDLFALRADGTQIPVDISVSPVEWGGRRFVVAAVRDIRERRRIEHALQDALRDRAMRDPLTGLFNRRVLDEALPLEFARARRSNAPVAVIMADIDHFKLVNDRCGHACGDSVLRRIALLLQVRMRAGDLACRYGGEEFTMILPGCTAEDARERAEAIREGICQTVWTTPDCSVAKVTASFGVAVYPDQGTTPEAVLLAADTALLLAKGSGRNRVVLAPDGGGEMVSKVKSA